MRPPVSGSLRRITMWAMSRSQFMAAAGISRGLFMNATSREPYSAAESACGIPRM